MAELPQSPKPRPLPPAPPTRDFIKRLTRLEELVRRLKNYNGDSPGWTPHAAKVQNMNDFINVNPSTLTAINFDHVLHVTAGDDAMWDSGTPSHLNAPVDGMYVVSADYGWTASGAGTTFIEADIRSILRVNGPDPGGGPSNVTNYSEVELGHRASGWALGPNGFTVSHTAVLNLVAGDFVELLVWHNYDSAHDLFSGSYTVPAPQTPNGGPMLSMALVS